MFNASLIKHPNQNQTKSHQIYFFSIFQIKLNELKLQETATNCQIINGTPKSTEFRPEISVNYSGGWEAKQTDKRKLRGEIISNSDGNNNNNNNSNNSHSNNSHSNNNSSDT